MGAKHDDISSATISAN